MLILLTHANHLPADAKQLRKMQPYAPLQTLIAAALLRREGFDVAFCDVTFERNFRTALADVQPDLVVVCEDNFNFLTKMCLLANRGLAFEIAREATHAGIPSIVNSSDATSRPEEYLKAGFAQVLVGELEATLVDAVRNWPRPVAGTAVSTQFGVRHIGQRAPLVDLDSLPSPAWDLVDWRRYRNAWTQAHGHFAVSLVSSRGCPYRCNWCAKPIHGSNYRANSPARTAAELARVKSLLKPDRVWFADDIFGLSAKWTREFADCLERHDARIPFKIQSRCDLMTRDYVAALVHAGCDEVWMGAESGSQRILDAMEKGTCVEDIHRASQNLRRHGIRTGLFLQFGYPGEQWEDIEATIRMVREIQPDDVGVSVSYPLPGSRFYSSIEAEIGEQSNWRESGDLAHMLSGQLPAELYRALSDAIHLEVRGGASGSERQQAWERVEQLRCACC